MGQAPSLPGELGFSILHERTAPLKHPMISRLLGLSLGGLLAACGAPSTPAPLALPVAPAAKPAATSVPVVKAPFAPLGPPGDMAPAEMAPGPRCTVTEHVLGPLADPGESLFPVTVVADAQGGLAAWLDSAGLVLQRLDTRGVPAGAAAHPAGTWAQIPRILLGQGETILLVEGPAEITVSRYERASLRPLGERRVPRPRELQWIVATGVEGADLWLVGVLDQALVFLSVGREGPIHTSVVALPEALPRDLLVTLGRKDGSMAVLISTIADQAWVATETGVAEAAPEDLTPSLGRFVRLFPNDFRTGATAHGLQTIPRYPLSRAADSELQQKTPPAAFVTHGSVGFPGEAWTGTHFLLGEAQGAWEEGKKKDKLSAVISAVDCHG